MCGVVAANSFYKGDSSIVFVGAINVQQARIFVNPVRSLLEITGPIFPTNLCGLLRQPPIVIWSRRCEGGIEVFGGGRWGGGGLLKN